LVPNIGLALKNSFISCNEELPKHV
jgi:serine/threonine protein phosphatase PrpC